MISNEEFKQKYNITLNNGLIIGYEEYRKRIQIACNCSFHKTLNRKEIIDYFCSDKYLSGKYGMLISYICNDAKYNDVWFIPELINE